MNEGDHEIHVYGEYADVACWAGLFWGVEIGNQREVWCIGCGEIVAVPSE